MITTHLSDPRLNPTKVGFCDGLFGRECKSPWPDFKRSRDYVLGYLRGSGDIKETNDRRN